MFIAQSAALGLLVALLLEYFYLQPQRQIANPQFTTAQAYSAGENHPQDKQPFSYRDAVTRAAPAVVNIFTAIHYHYKTGPKQISPLFDKLFGSGTGGEPVNRMENSVGSGVIVGTSGYILTNNHVIANADEIQVILSDGDSYQAELIGSDHETDLAVLKIHTSRTLPTIELASKTSVSVGDVVLAIGNPFGVGQTVTQGIVSATSRNRLGLNTFEEFIQTDAAINPGNSGGALVNSEGQLVGINTAIFSDSEGAQGISFAIPISLAENVMLQIIEYGEVIRGWLGVQAYDITVEMRQRFNFTGPGVLITGVFRDSPAELAGIMAGDILTHIEREPLLNTQVLFSATKNHPPQTRVTVTGLRNGRKYSLMTTLIRKPGH